MITVCGANTSIEEVYAIEAPETMKNAGRRWKPIAHYDLIDALRDEFEVRGWRMTDSQFSASKDGVNLAGAVSLEGVPGVDLGPTMGLSLGFLNCNDRRKALALSVGANVFCCLNGMVTGEVILNRVHDHTVDLQAEIQVALSKYEVAARAIPAVVDGLKRREISDAEASEILMETGRRGLIGWTAVGRVDAEYRNPTFAEHGTGTSWALLNAFTFTARNNIAPARQMEAYNEFRQMLPVFN